MRSLGELAEDYERWADENDAVALEIMSNAGNFRDGSEKQLYVSVLAAQADSFRQQAALLRESALEQIPVWLGSKAQARPC